MSSASTFVDSEIADTPILKLLLVEDDLVMQLGLEQFFSRYPTFKVVGQATDGYAAIGEANHHQPDLILMDVGLPHLDGIAATRHIKETFPHMRILMLTSHADETEVIAALSSGADGYCIKGTQLSSLLNAIAVVQDGAMYLDPQIARTVIEHLKPPRPSQAIAQLSPQELEILKLIVEGYTNPEIAETLYLSLSTVKAHIRNIMNKLAVDDRVKAAVIALRSGLV
jgi:two-component system, NarL family, response regulator LiaR